MSAKTDTTTEGRIEPKIDADAALVEEIAARVAAADTEPTAGAVRDRALDVVAVSPRFVTDGRPLAEAVRDELDDAE